MLSKKIVVKKTLTRGLGLYANAAILEGEVVWSLDKTENQLTKNELNSLPQSLQNLAFQYFDKYIIVSDGSQYMNHSCNPNSWWLGDSTLIASKNIKKGEEVTYDYSTADIGDWIAEWECKCNSSNCRKFITGKDILNKKLQKKYQDHLPTWVVNFINNETI